MSVNYCKAQTSFALLDTNNVRATVNANGLLFSTPQSSDPGFEVPIGSLIHTIFASNLWIGGLSENQELHLAAPTFCANGNDFFSGPLSIDNLGQVSISQDQMDLYNQIWVGNTNDISVHKLYFEALENGTENIEFPNGYIVPNWILNWPAQGNTSVNQSQYLAPFFDYDQDGVYNPNLGDYPYSLGDKFLYFIINDVGGSHLESQGLPLGIEVHVLVYAFNNNLNSAINNSVFVNYKIVNRTSISYSDCYLAMWTDLDIGNSTDDYVACDVRYSNYYGYNGDSMDEPISSSIGYGSSTPVQCVTFLGGPLVDEDGIDNSLPLQLQDYGTYGPFGPGYGDGLIDNERLGMSAFMYHNIGTNPITGDPNVPSDYYNYMRSLWKDGSPLKYGGNGYIGFGVLDTTTTYYCPASSDSAHFATNGVALDSWSEETSSNLPGDRRGVGSCGPFTFSPNEVVSFDVAFTYAEETGTGLSESEWVAAMMYQLRSHYSSEIAYQNDRLGPISSIYENENRIPSVQLFPNPAGQWLQIEVPKNFQFKTIKVFDMAGHQLSQYKMGANTSQLQLDISTLASGLYFLRVEGETGWVQSVRFVVE